MRQILPTLLNLFALGLYHSCTFYMGGPSKPHLIKNNPTPTMPAPLPVAAPPPTAPKAEVKSFKTKKGEDRRRVLGSGFGAGSGGESETLGGGIS